MHRGSLIVALVALAGAALAEAPKDPKAMKFATAAEQGRFDALRAELGRRAAGWRHVGPDFVGNFITERWCAPAVKPGPCERGAVVTDLSGGLAYAQLETLHHDKDWPTVFGLAVQVADLPPEKDALGVRFSLAEGGRTILAEGMQVTWLGNDGGTYAPRASLGVTMGVKVGETEVQLAAPEGWKAELRLLAASPASLRDRALARYEALRAAAVARLDSGEITGFDVGPYKGGGIPPTRTPRPLTAAEKAALRERLDKEIADQVGFVRANHEAMHARLRAVVPLETLLR